MKKDEVLRKLVIAWREEKKTMNICLDVFLDCSIPYFTRCSCFSEALRHQKEIENLEHKIIMRVLVLYR